METLIEDLLKLSRVSRSELQTQQVNLSHIAELIAADLKKSDPQRAVEFVIEPGLQAHGDERLLRVAMDNLLRNAWKFTSKQPLAKIEVGSSKGPPQAFFVRDNGAGFDMTYSSRLFGVFQRLHTVSEFPGTGVGLATVQRIISRHGGRVWATGEVNRGATFYFTLPPDEHMWDESQTASTAGNTSESAEPISAQRNG
jgi:light-regulated signal transduction histidine kinase (bacteriophytochrome)